MSMVNVIKLKGKFKKFSEETQASNIKFIPATFNIIDDTVTCLTHPFKCKDFLSELFPASLYGKEYEVYNFVAEPHFLESINSFVLTGTSEELTKIRNSFSILNSLERKAGYKLTTYCKVNSTNLLIHINDRTWLKTPWALSLYTLILRVMCYESIPDTVTTFYKLIKYCKSDHVKYTNISDLLKIQLLNKFTYKKLWLMLRAIKQKEVQNVILDEEYIRNNIYSYHANSGIQSLVLSVIKQLPNDKLHPQVKLSIEELNNLGVKIN